MCIVYLLMMHLRSLYQSLSPMPKRKAPLAGAFLFGSEMRPEPRAHPGYRREWAWSATAAGGGRRERDKGENKESRGRSDSAPGTTIFSTGQ